MKTLYKVKDSILADYETILFDLDGTIWECFDARGTAIPAFKMEPPFRLLEEDLVGDIRKNICRLQPKLRDVLISLDEYGTNLGVVSRSAVKDVSDEAQPARMLLGKLALLQYFTYIVVIKAGIDKGNYARGEGRTLFIDDDPRMLQTVNDRGLVDVLSRKKFVGWETLFTSSKDVKPLPTTVQNFKNAPQPTTSALKFSAIKIATPETYTDKSDIDAGIGGSARNMADMWHMEDHLEIDNGRDHVWQEPWEPQDQYFLNETDVTPKTDDKLKMQHPDKGGIANSSLSLADQQLYAQSAEIALKLRTQSASVVHSALAAYYGVSEENISASTELIQQAIQQVGMTDSPKAEQYPDYYGTTDVSPKDPKHQDELEEPWSVRRDLERQYFETGLHSSPDRPETMRPLTPYASHGEEPPANLELHRPNTILVHEGVLQALTFAESVKPDALVNHEAREDYRYVAPQHS